MAQGSPKLWWWVGGLSASATITVLTAWVFRAQIRKAGAAVWDEGKVLAFKAAVAATTPFGRALKYADQALQVGAEETMNPFVIIGLMERESGSGAFLSPKNDPGGVGDIVNGVGHGRGLMQLDINGAPSPDSLHAQILADGRWTDPYWNMKAAVVDHLRPDITYFVQQGLSGDDILRAALVAYNHGRKNVMAYIKAGRNPDELTTGKNYSADVLARIAKMSSGFSFA